MECGVAQSTGRGRGAGQAAGTAGHAHTTTLRKARAAHTHCPSQSSVECSIAHSAQNRGCTGQTSRERRPTASTHRHAGVVVPTRTPTDSPAQGPGLRRIAQCAGRAGRARLAAHNQRRAEHAASRPRVRVARRGTLAQIAALDAVACAACAVRGGHVAVGAHGAARAARVYSDVVVPG